jgi:hypothetical protein
MAYLRTEAQKTSAWQSIMLGFSGLYNTIKSANEMQANHDNYEEHLILISHLMFFRERGLAYFTEEQENEMLDYFLDVAIYGANN